MIRAFQSAVIRANIWAVNPWSGLNQAIELVSASVAELISDYVLLTFTESLDNSTPDISAFAVLGKTVVDVEVTGTEVKVYVNPYFAYGDVSTINYTQPVLNPLKKGSVKVASFVEQEITNGTINPYAIANLIRNWDADHVTAVDGYADVLLDQSGQGFDLTAPDGTRRPAILANDKNGNPALVFDGTNDRLTKLTTLTSVPFTCYLAAKLTTYAAGKTLLSAAASPYSQLVRAGSNAYQIVISTPLTLKIQQPITNDAINVIVANGANSTYDFNGEFITGDSGTTASLKGITLGSNSNADIDPWNGKFWKGLIYSGVHDAATKSKVVKYLQDKYDIAINKFDGILSNSVLYEDKTTYRIRNPFSQYSFYYTGTKLQIVYRNDLPPSYTESSAGGTIYVNDEYYQDYIRPYTGEFIFNVSFDLPSGRKKITICDGISGRPEIGQSLLGNWLTKVIVDSSYEKISETNIPEKLVFLGDSITLGYRCNHPTNEAYSRLFYVENNKQVAVHGWSAAYLSEFASDETKINTTVSYLTSLFSNVYSIKKLIILIGVNDEAAAETDAPTFSGWYATLLDAINAADNTIQIYCISPLARNLENSLLADYRTAISGLCATRAYTTYINGQPILTLPGDFSDGLHPTAAGHKKLKDAVYSVMYPS